MSEEKTDAIARRPNVGMANGMFQPQNLQEAIEVAKLIANSGMVPKQYENNPGAVLVAVQMGAEVGLSSMASIQNIAVINGRPSLWGDAALAAVMAHHEFKDIDEEINSEKQEASCTVVRKGHTSVTRTFSMDDAKRAGLLGKQGPWTQYPKRMLQMRARAFALRDAFPDALRGIRLAEEEQDVVVEHKPALELKPGTVAFRKLPEAKIITPVEAPVIDAKVEQPTPEPAKRGRPPRAKTEETPKSVVHDFSVLPKLDGGHDGERIIDQEIATLDRYIGLLAEFVEDHPDQSEVMNGYGRAIMVVLDSRPPENPQIGLL